MLGLFGGKDVQVPATSQAPAMRAALGQAGNRDVTITTIPDANHLFQSAKTGAVGEYGSLPQTFTPDFLPTLVDWVDSTRRRRTVSTEVPIPVRTTVPSTGTPNPSSSMSATLRVSRAALERLGHDAWGAALDYLYDEAFRRAMGEPTTAVPLRARVLRRAGGPAPGTGRPDASRSTCWRSSGIG